MKHFYTLTVLLVISTSVFSQQQQNLQRINKGQSFAIDIQNDNVGRPRILQGILKTIGIGAAYHLIKGNFQASAKVTGQQHVIKDALPFGLGLALSYKDFIPSAMKL